MHPALRGFRSVLFLDSDSELPAPWTEDPLAALQRDGREGFKMLESEPNHAPNHAAGWLHRGLHSSNPRRLHMQPGPMAALQHDGG